MTTIRQILANRRNAALSRGPNTAAGKARSRLNALRHGFAAKLAMPLSQDIETLAQALVAEFGEGFTADARKAAEAQIDLLRVRAVRLNLLDRTEACASSRGSDQQVVSSVSELQRLDRYERRAFSKRRKAFHALENDV
jgi:hypothetical protein